MSNTNETITDIIRKIRAEADSIEASVRGSLKAGEGLNGVPFTESDLEPALDLVMTKRKEADRLEAALGREKAAIEADALTVGGTVEALRATAENPSAVGNMAAMRHALAIVYDWILKAGNVYGYPDTEQKRRQLYDMMTKALAAPARNCDVARDWLHLYAHFKPPATVRREMPPEWVDAVMAFCKWLVAQAKDAKGETDGSK